MRVVLLVGGGLVLLGLAAAALFALGMAGLCTRAERRTCPRSQGPIAYGRCTCGEHDDPPSIIVPLRELP